MVGAGYYVRVEGCEEGVKVDGRLGVLEGCECRLSCAGGVKERDVSRKKERGKR